MKGANLHPLRTIIRGFDDWLSRLEGVRPFDDDSRIILRLQGGHVPHDVSLPARRIPSGAPALILHFWNERMPPIGPQGATLPWALQFQRRLIYSFHAVSRLVQVTDVMKAVQVMGGVIAHVRTDIPDGGTLLLERLGFTVMPYHRPAGAFGEFWENFYTWLLIWTYNPASLRSHALFGLQRNEFWTTSDDFLERFGNNWKENEPAMNLSIPPGN